MSKLNKLIIIELFALDIILVLVGEAEPKIEVK